MGRPPYVRDVMVYRRRSSGALILCMYAVDGYLMELALGLSLLHYCSFVNLMAKTSRRYLLGLNKSLCQSITVRA